MSVAFYVIYANTIPYTVCCLKIETDVDNYWDQKITFYTNAQTTKNAIASDQMPEFVILS